MSIDAIDILAVVARTLYTAALGPSETSMCMQRWMHDVRDGDHVVEVTTDHEPKWKRFGVLKCMRVEPLFDDRLVHYADEKRWVIDTSQGEVEWRDARFVRVPITTHEALVFWNGPQQDCFEYRVFPCVECERARGRGERPLRPPRG